MLLKIVILYLVSVVLHSILNVKLEVFFFFFNKITTSLVLETEFTAIILCFFSDVFSPVSAT